MKGEISWVRRTDDGKLQVFAKHAGNRWLFFAREKRFDDWQPVENPPLEDWLELLDSVQRRIARRLVKPEQEALVKKTIRQRFPDWEEVN